MGPELPGGRCQTYVTGSKGVSHWESGKKCLMCVLGRLSVGLIRCTGYACQYYNFFKPPSISMKIASLILGMRMGNMGYLQFNLVKIQISLILMKIKPYVLDTK